MLRHMFLAACACLFTVFSLSGKASVTTDMRIMNSVQIDTLFQEGEEALERGDIDDALKIFTVVCSRDDGADSRRLFSMAHLPGAATYFIHARIMPKPCRHIFRPAA